jgi:hypothetical protein
MLSRMVCDSHNDNDGEATAVCASPASKVDEAEAGQSKASVDSISLTGVACRFAREAAVLQQVGSVLLDQSLETKTLRPTSWIVATDAFEVAPEVADAIYKVMSTGLDKVQNILGAPKELAITGVCLCDHACLQVCDSVTMLAHMCVTLWASILSCC